MVTCSDLWPRRALRSSKPTPPARGLPSGVVDPRRGLPRPGERDFRMLTSTALDHRSGDVIEHDVAVQAVLDELFRNHKDRCLKLRSLSADFSRGCVVEGFNCARQRLLIEVNGASGLENRRAGKFLDIVEEGIEGASSAIDVSVCDRFCDCPMQARHLRQVRRLLVVQVPEPTR